jgi:uncharacterized membrane protein YdjX (TVP38/TMEM64 family)
MSRHPVLRGFFLLVALAAIGYVIEQSGVFARLSPSWIDAEIRGHGLRGSLLFVVFGAMATAVGVPRQIVSFLGGYAFGFVTGTLLSAAATLMGCVLTFSFSRLVARAVIRRRFEGRIRRFEEFLQSAPLSMTLMIRLLPMGNNMVTSLVAGFSRVPALPFFAGSLIGYIPQTATFALVGSGINVDSVVRVCLGAALFVISGTIGMHLARTCGRFVAGDAAEMDGLRAESRSESLGEAR